MKLLNIFDILYKKLEAAILNARKSRTGIMDIVLYGGIRYQFVYAGDNARGHKFNKVFIQRFEFKQFNTSLSKCNAANTCKYKNNYKWLKNRF